MKIHGRLREGYRVLQGVTFRCLRATHAVGYLSYVPMRLLVWRYPSRQGLWGTPCQRHVCVYVVYPGHGFVHRVACSFFLEASVLVEIYRPSSGPPQKAFRGAHNNYENYRPRPGFIFLRVRFALFSVQRFPGLLLSGVD